MRFRNLSGLALAACLLASGCALPVSEHPLSDETTSTLDERLIGYWKFVPKEIGEQPPPVPHLVSRVKDKPNVLQMTQIEIDGEGYEKITRVPLYATKIGEECYLSFNMREEEGKKAYLICRYELSDEGEGKLSLMKPELVAAAIESGKLSGVVKRQKRRDGADPNEPTRFDEILITAKPKELTDFLKERGKAIFAMEETMVFQRVMME